MNSSNDCIWDSQSSAAAVHPDELHNVEIETETKMLDNFSLNPLNRCDLNKY